jgi:hypothetical protein
VACSKRTSGGIRRGSDIDRDARCHAGIDGVAAGLEDRERNTLQLSWSSLLARHAKQSMK